MCILVLYIHLYIRDFINNALPLACDYIYIRQSGNITLRIARYILLLQHLCSDVFVSICVMCIICFFHFRLCIGYGYMYHKTAHNVATTTIITPIEHAQFIHKVRCEIPANPSSSIYNVVELRTITHDDDRHYRVSF